PAAGALVNPGQRRYDQKAWLGAHNAYADATRYTLPNQNLTIGGQLRQGVRFLALDTWLVRQLLVHDSLLVQFYEKASDTAHVKDPRLRNEPLRVVLAHRSASSGQRIPLRGGKNYQLLRSALDTVNHFLGSTVGRQTIVTVTFENHVPVAGLVNHIVDLSGLGARRFYLDTENVAIPAPAGQSGGWVVARYGAPSIQLLNEHGKNFVVIPPRGHEVRTVYGDASVEPGHWTDYFPTEARPNDFSAELFEVPTSTDLPVRAAARADNSYPRLRTKLDDVVARWHRIPNLATFDFVDLGHNLSAGFLRWSTRYFTNVDLEALWRHTITPAVDLDRQPSAAGWFHDSVHVVRFYARGNRPAVRAAVAASWMAGDMSVANYGQYKAVQPDFPAFTQEGRHTLGFCVVDRQYGRRSTQMLVPIRIDMTPPQVSLATDIDSLWPPNGKPVAVTVSGTATDALSGLATPGISYQVIDEYGTDQPSGEAVVDPAGHFTFTVDLISARSGTDRDGRTYRVEVTATDNADNSGVTDATVVVPHDQG
ncbi:MAG TPA: hypothetical protein VNH46_06125, partial [Gemmatimonadales bacterium]|nr:hypothetical protein [Gemmatimonadales bacterium]